MSARRTPGRRAWSRRPDIRKSRRWAELRRELLHEARNACAECARTFPSRRLELDHVVALIRGGDPWARWNLRVLCIGCHIAKSRGEKSTAPRYATHGRGAWLLFVDELR